VAKLIVVMLRLIARRALRLSAGSGIVELGLLRHALLGRPLLLRRRSARPEIVRERIHILSAGVGIRHASLTSYGVHIKREDGCNEQ
jgi:hypothetical protein